MRRAKKKTRDVALSLHLFGVLLPGQALDYTLWVGLVLNVPRVLLLAAAASLLGTSHAASDGKLDDSWFDALAEFPEEIEDMKHEANQKRAIVRVLRQIRER